MVNVLIINKEKEEIKDLESLIKSSEDVNILSKNNLDKITYFINSKGIELVIIDTDFDKKDILKVCWEIKRSHARVRIIVTGDIVPDEESYLKIDIDDFVQKPINNSIFKLRIHNQIKIITLINKFELESSKDYLTGLYNRKAFFKSLDRKICKYKNNDMFGCFVIGDIDFFKHFNDDYSHSVGDTVLKNVSTNINYNLKKYKASLYRWGGEEFVFLLVSKDKDSFFDIIEKLREEVSNIKINIGNKDLNLTMSFGGYIFNFNNFDKDNMLNKADEYLYIAKNSGRNKTVVK